MYCDVEQSLWRDESDEHPRNMEEKSMNETVACRGDVEVHSTPYTYGQGAEAEGEDPKRGPLPQFSNPQKRRIGFRVLHLCYVSVKEYI